ncbi:hypothetical protein LCGC14_0809880 [marine sediment metagenome]|uniref:Uncharacterized protein n=1 Tax=marine sediment metagenome TaxID=412755 RepID=A0A0F9S778_9ZZZZ|nr:MAG: hypothetical protein Lokiarch_40090 [Candidatus Lokiarchaeum sp. GC14_75]
MPLRAFNRQLRDIFDCKKLPESPEKYLWNCIDCKELLFLIEYIDNVDTKKHYVFAHGYEIADIIEEVGENPYTIYTPGKNKMDKFAMSLIPENPST